jgi:nucleoside phosphorylase
LLTCDVLILAAFRPELTPLEPLLGPSMRARVESHDVVARVVGIGATMAAVGAAMLLGDLRPRRAVLVGTCGAYAQSGLLIGDVAVPAHVRLAAPCVADGMAEFPAPMSLVSEAHVPTLEGLVRAGGKAADVASTLAITVDDAAAARLERATGDRVEHLEAHGVATACAARGVPFGAALGVANIVGSRARQEWLANHRAAAAAAIEVVARWLRSGEAW